MSVIAERRRNFSPQGEKHASQYALPWGLTGRGEPVRWDGYQPPRDEQGVYCIVTYDGKILVVRSNGENEGKSEAVGFGNLQQVQPHHLEIVTGRVEAGELQHAAVWREVWEELGVRVSPRQFVNSQPEIRVMQIRNGVYHSFIVQGFLLKLTSEQVAKILTGIPSAQLVALQEIYSMLQDSPEQFRPATLAALREFMNAMEASRIDLNWE